MNIIFLDIDGVVNTDRQIRINTLHQINDIDFDPQAMNNLKQIIEQTSSKIVISSTWRTHERENGYLWQELIRNFKGYDLNPDVIIGSTPVISETMKPELRELEIANWLIENPIVEKFVILDDQWSMGNLNDHFIRCLSFNGITTEIAEKSIKMLNT